MKKRNLIGLSLIVVLIFSSCILTSGSIYIKENYVNRGFDISFLQWSNQKDCKIELNRNDKLKVEIDCYEGKIALEIIDNYGNKEYMGNGLNDAYFIVTVSNTGQYHINIKGYRASGNIKINKL